MFIHSGQQDCQVVYCETAQTSGRSNPNVYLICLNLGLKSGQNGIVSAYQNVKQHVFDLLNFQWEDFFNYNRKTRRQSALYPFYKAFNQMGLHSFTLLVQMSYSSRYA